MQDLFQLYHPDVTAFAEAFSGPVDGLLTEIEQYTLQHHAEPHMLSGKQQGLLLKFISEMMQPMRVLEIGTFTGYSALCLAAGMQEGGQLLTIESRENTAAIAQSFFEKSPLKNKIHLHTGDAKTIIPTLNETWDLVFIDADKTGYAAYYDLILPQVRKGGFILADNIFFHGHALEAEPKGKSAKAVQQFNEKILQDTRVEKLALTIRDGLYIIRKK